MKTLTQVKKEMLSYARTNVDLEEGETAKDWVDTFVEALREEGSIVVINGKEYVKDLGE